MVVASGFQRREKEQSHARARRAREKSEGLLGTLVCGLVVLGLANSWLWLVGWPALGLGSDLRIGP